MNSKNIKVVDEHNFDRSANILFSFELEGSGYVSYSIERDTENVNIFLSKVLRNLDGTFNMLDIDDSMEKAKLNDIVKTIITKSVENQEDKFAGDSLTLVDGKVVKFIPVNFNKEQRINVTKTYITTVKKEVIRVVEKYYDIQFSVEQPKEIEDIFPSVTPVVEPVKEVVPVEVTPVVEPQPVVVETPVVATPTVEVPKVEPILPVQNIEPQILPSEVPVMEPVKEVAPVEVTPVVETPVVPTVLEPITEAMPESVVVEQPAVVSPTPMPVVEESQPLVFNASKETNLNAALGEVANTATIPVENIEPVREFGVDAPIQQPVVNEQPVVQNDTTTDAATSGTVSGNVTKKAGFANSKFFMVVAIAFFLASCVFLGYEVFNYFQLTK